jgi:hypothetical protein
VTQSGHSVMGRGVGTRNSHANNSGFSTAMSGCDLRHRLEYGAATNRAALDPWRQYQTIAISRRPRDVLARDVAAGSRPRIDDHGCVHRLRQRRPHDPRGDISSATW